MADCNPPPRYVGYRRPLAGTPQSMVARLVELRRIQLNYVLQSLAVAVFSFSRFYDLHFTHPLYRAGAVAFLVVYSVCVYRTASRLAVVKGWKSIFGIFSAVTIFLPVPLILLNDGPYLSAVSNFLIAFSNFWNCLWACLIAVELKHHGFSSWREASKKIRLVQAQERETYVPPIPEGLYSGEPPKISGRSS